jgi:hypothetical protein
VLALLRLGYLSCRLRYLISKPKYLVRLCYSRNELVRIVNAARKEAASWPNDLLAQCIDQVFGDTAEGLSLFAAKTRSPFDVGHAFGVISATM